MKQDSAVRYMKQQIWRQRIGYGVSSFACNLIWQMISLYLLYFYADVMFLNAKSITFMFVVTRFIDGGMDLLIGYCIDHTRIRWGKSGPCFLFGAIPLALFAILAFSVPNISQSGKLIYACTTYIGLSFTYTVVNIPMISILPSLTTDTRERIALSTTRKFFAFLGSIVVSSTALKLVDSLGKGSEALGFRIVMVIFGLIGYLLFFFIFATVKERVNTAAESVSLKENLMSLGENKPWLIFALNIIFIWTGFFLQTSAIVYCYAAVIGNKELSVTIATIVSVVLMAASFLMPVLVGRMGKRNLHVGSIVIQLAGLVIILFASINHGAVLVGAMVTALGYGIKESIYFSMQADPADYGEWKTGINTVGPLSAINGFLGKVVQAATGGISGVLLAWGIYQGGASVQSSNAVLAIKTMYLYISTLLLIYSIVTMLFYNLDEIYSRTKAVLDSRNE